ncbi:hypothetical protein [Halorubellus sp. PRR65]|uniref:hypothetical protein n=1 Tax=Halorubellus sp. PRR65 TaxID=3098148 RepID=UPI002B25C5DC|nr:hypothetical protein [Halorubellus sp. PRR65]
MRAPRLQSSEGVFVVACWLVVALAGWQGVVASGYTSGDAARHSDAAVTADDGAAHGLAVNDSVSVNASDRLVTVTNRLGREVTVTVALDPDSRDVGELVRDGASAGDTATFALAAGASEQVSIDVPDDGSLDGRDVVFDVTADDVGLWVNASNRSVPVTSS